MLLVWVGQGQLAMVIGVTLAATAVVATLVASLLPWGLARLGVDPALASGPVATVVQDLSALRSIWALLPRCFEGDVMNNPQAGIR